MNVDAFGLRLDREPELAPDFVRAIPLADDGALALFDADGTLWTDDVADDFTRWMIDNGHISDALWPQYMRIYRDDAPAGCRFLLRLYQGLHPEELAARVEHWWLRHARRTWVWPVIESMHLLAERGHEVWVVTGSPSNLMLPLLQMLPVSRIVGMDYEIGPDGRFTGNHSGISCAGTGKAEKVRSIAGDRRVAFCAGNGNLDGPMMELAQVAWAIYPNPEFAEHARGHGWPILPRPADFVEEQKFLLED